MKTYQNIITKAFEYCKSANVATWAFHATGHMSLYKDIEFQDLDYDINSTEYMTFDKFKGKEINVAVYLLDNRGNKKALAIVPVVFYEDRRKKARVLSYKAEIYDLSANLLYKPVAA